ncbi:hypothetical protein [Chitinophaga sp.]|uniref:hypothetical protein n=1 Tax=Chitinophaga sp. TaxID=1869181 RepID=UPI0031DEBFE8
MQLLDDDMDELFRNAASQYPLKTDGADWDALSSRLQSAAPQGSVAAGARSNKWVGLGVSILLTVLFFITYAPPLETGNLPRTGKEIAKTTTTGTDIHTSTHPNTGTGTNPHTGSNNSAINQTNTITNTVSNTTNRTYTAKNNKSNNISTAFSGINADTLNYSKATILNNKQTSTFVNGVRTNEKPDNSLAAVKTILPADSATMPGINMPVNNISLPTMNVELSATKKQAPAKVQKGLYFGIIASPDISTVKMQRVNKVGYGAGIILGYRISRSFAVETGLLYDHKNYYSEGNYFNKSKIPAIQNWQILDVEGYCNMYEIPVNVRYFIRNGEKTSWYANAGLSSYLMKKEDYSYEYKMYSGDVNTASWAYKNATKNWFSIIHVGVGLEHNLGAIGKLRVEPYLKIPAKGLGIGDLPITSMGINIGITKSIR